MSKLLKALQDEDAFMHYIGTTSFEEVRKEILAIKEPSEATLVDLMAMTIGGGIISNNQLTRSQSTLKEVPAQAYNLAEEMVKEKGRRHMMRLRGVPHA